jgi:hypothetical protein
MLWRSSILVMSVWFAGGFLNLNRDFFLAIWEIFCYNLVEYIMHNFGLHLFSFDAHDLQVWFFDVIADFLHIPFTALESFV